VVLPPASPADATPPAAGDLDLPGIDRRLEAPNPVAPSSIESAVIRTAAVGALPQRPVVEAPAASLARTGASTLALALIGTMTLLFGALALGSAARLARHTCGDA
jgi:hypothetical protein